MTGGMELSRATSQIITNYKLRITNEERRSKRIKNLLFRLDLRSSFVIRNS